jgi:hypothetical protein
MVRCFVVLFFALAIDLPALASSQLGRATVVKVWVLNFDPIVDAQTTMRLHEKCGWLDPRELAKQYVADVKEASSGLVTFEIVGWEDLDEFPDKEDGFRYTLDSYMECRRTGIGWHQPDIADYPKLITKYNLVDKVESGLVDEVWWFGAPYFGFGESAMAGRNAFYINGPVYDAPKVKCRRAFAIMGFNYERGPAEMIHNLCHRTESTLSRVFGGWRADQLDSDWAHFAANAHQSNGVAGVGSCHFPPNGKSDYDYANATFVESTAEDWLGYPKLTGAKRKVNCETWGGPDFQRNYLKWWFAHLPKVAGVNPITLRQNNWWEYVFRFNEYGPLGFPAAPINPTQEQAAAKAVLAAGGKIVLLTSDGTEELSVASELPKEDIEVREIHMVGLAPGEELIAKLDKLPSLRRLNLGAADIGDKEVARLTSLPALEWLSLGNTKITDDALKHASRWPQLNYLELNNTAIGDAALVHLARHPALQELHLTNTSVTDVGARKLIAIPRLTKVSLAESKITDAGLVHLAKLKRLSVVWLNHAKVTDDGLAKLRRSLPDLTIHR